MKGLVSFGSGIFTCVAFIYVSGLLFTVVCKSVGFDFLFFLASQLSNNKPLL